MDLLVTGGTVVTMDPARRVIPDGAVAIEGNRIVAVGPRAELPATATTVIDATGHAILPGLIDGHAHAGHGLVKTLGGGDSEAWGEACRVIYTTASPPPFWRAEARLAALERLMFGVTTGFSLLGGGDSVMRTDTPAHGDAHCAGVAEVGIRTIMAVGPTRPPHPRTYADAEGREYPVGFEQQLDTIQALIERWHGAEEGRIAVSTLMPVYRQATHDPAAVAEIERQGRLLQDLGRRHGTLFHQDGHRSGSLEMAGRMFGLLGPDALMSHCTDLTEADIDAVAGSGTRIVHNPSAIASVRGYCPVPTLLDRGVLVMLGSDGTAPDRSTDMFRHMFQCMRLHQRQHRDERLMPPGKLLEMVTIDAARALHMDDRIGSLEPGKRADLITVDLRKPHLTPANMPVWRLVCFANGQDVDTVIVDGRLLMRDRRVPHLDVAEVMAAAEAETAQMLARTGFAPMLAEPATIWGRRAALIPLWLPVTVAAALFQTWRTALQQRLRGTLSVGTAGLVRYLYAIPVGLLFLALYCVATGQRPPTPTAGFLLGCAVGGLGQIAGTSLLIMAFGYRNFAVGTAYSKTDAVQAAVVAGVLLHERLSTLAWCGIGVGVVGVLTLSLAGRGLRPGDLLRATVQPAALCGLGAGTGFAVAGVGIKAATVSLHVPDAVLAALFALVVTNTLQTLMQGAWMAWREPAGLRAAFTAWRSAAWVGVLSASGSACWFAGFALAPVALVRTVGQVEMVFTLLFSRYYLNETLRRADVAGLALIVAGVVVVLAGH